MFALVVTSCDGNGTTLPSEPAPTVTSTTSPAPVDDGTLRIGLLLPDSGDGVTIGQPMIDAARLAADRINAAGGVLGKPIEVVDGPDEGDSATTARDAISALRDQDVDAVVGPASSPIALATLDELLTRGVLTCSPTASSLALDAYPDSELFFRTIPSDSLQAVAIGQLAEETGARSAIVTYLDDAYGRPFGEATVDALRARGMTVVDPVPFAAGNPSLTVEASAIDQSDVGVVVVIADGEQGTRMLTALGEVADLFPDQDAPLIIVNDAIRRPPSSQLVQALAADLRTRVVGLSPRAIGTEAGEPTGAYATNAYDCVNLIALAAAQAESDSGEEMADQMVEASSGGVSCREFDDCVQLLADDRNVDYDGPSGNLELGPSGDPVRARFDRFTFDERGVDVGAGSLTVTP